VYGRWVRFTFGHDIASIGGMAIDEKNRKREAGEASASSTPASHGNLPREVSHPSQSYE